MNKHYVFVYGTLKKGERANFKLDASDFRGGFMTQMKFRLFGEAFPMAFLDEEGHNVAGEVYYVDDPTLDRLDQYEGYPGFYTRDKITVRGRTTGLILSCWMYHIPVKESDSLALNYPVPPDKKGVIDWKGKD